jgi:hypothetical protein
VVAHDRRLSRLHVLLLPCVLGVLHRAAAVQLVVKADLEAGLALRAGQQSAALKDAQAKISALEGSLHQVCMAVACERSSSGEPPASTSCTEAAAGGGSSSSSCQPQLQDGCGSVARHDPGPQHQAEVPQASAACAADAAAGDGEAAAAAVDGLDIRDLSWVDRERVLRLLLAKINGKAAEHRALQAAAAAAAAAAAGDDASAGSRGSAPQHAGRAC